MLRSLQETKCDPLLPLLLLQSTQTKFKQQQIDLNELLGSLRSMELIKTHLSSFRLFLSHLSLVIWAHLGSFHLI